MSLADLWRRAHWRSVLPLLASSLVALIVALDWQPARAHGYILRSIPADGSVLARAPSRIQIWFTENLEAQFSTLNVTNHKGDVIPLTNVGVAPNNPTELVARLPSSLPDGAYVVTVRAAFASDGHVGTEDLIFWVGAQAGEESANVGVIAQRAIPLEIIWRILTLLPLSILFGALLLYRVVLLPGWGNLKYRAGGLAPRLMEQLNTLIWVALATAMAGSVIALLQQSAALFSTSVDAAINNGLWLVVLRSTQFGDLLTLRIMLLVAMAAIHGGSRYLATRRPGDVGLLWQANTALAAVSLGTLSASSHAAGSTLWPLASIVVDWLHLLANAAWIGGLVALVIVMPVALGPLTRSERRMAFLVALRRFSVIGVAAVAMMMATGIYSALLYVRQPSDLSNTTYGGSLVFKALLVVPLLLLGLYHHVSVTHGRLAMAAQRLHIPERVSDLAASVRLESILGMGVILVASVLTATPPPVPPEARARVEPPAQTQSVDDTQIRLNIDPGAVGANSYQIDVSRSGQPLPGAEVDLRLVYPSLDKRSGLLPLDDAGNGSYIGAGPDLDRAGQWQALVDVTERGQTGTPVRAAFRWDVPETVPNPSQRQPTPLNWLAGGLVVIVLGAWLYPGTIGRLRSAHVQPEIATGAAMAVVVTVALAGLGAWMLNDSAQRTEALRNPPPLVVNPTLADASSLAAGKAIYDARCVGCHGPSGAGDGLQAVRSPASAPADFRARLRNKRDEDLFKVIPHANSGDQFSTDDRWNVINYLRSAVFAPPGKS